MAWKKNNVKKKAWRTKLMNFMNNFRNLINQYNKPDHPLILGDLNVRIGNVPIPDVIGISGEICLNNNDKRLRPSC